MGEHELWAESNAANWEEGACHKGVSSSQAYFEGLRSDWTTEFLGISGTVAKLELRLITRITAHRFLPG